jgi:hypothetical protein
MSRSRSPKVRAAASCGNHGGCPWCEGNRLHASRVREQAATERERPLSHPMFGDFECDDYVFNIRSQAMFDDEDFPGWWEDHNNDRGALYVPLLDAARFR